MRFRRPGNHARLLAAFIAAPTILVAPLAAQDVPAPDLELGRSTAAVADQLFFHQVEGLAVLPAGELLVVDAAGLLRVLDSRGRVKHRARRGGGPGEFEAPSLAGTFGDSIWIWDATLTRITRASLSLDEPETVAVPFMASRIAAIRGGGFVASRATASEQSLLFLDPDATSVRDSLHLGPQPRPLRVESGGFTHVTRQPWADHPVWAASAAGEGFAVIERPTSGPAEVAVRRYDRTGRLVRVDTIRYRPHPLTRAYVREFSRQMAEAYAQGAARQGIPFDRTRFEDALGDSLYRPQRLPAVSTAILSGHGDLYLRRYPTPDDAATEYWVLAPDGRLGSAWFPRDFRLLFADTKHAWGVRIAPDDTEYLVRYPIQ